MTAATNLSQVDILLSLGVDVNTADGYILYTTDKKGNIKHLEKYMLPENMTYTDQEQYYSKGIIKPSWSTYAVLKLLPKNIVKGDKNYILNVIPEDSIKYENNGNILAEIKISETTNMIQAAIIFLNIYGVL